MAKTELFSLGKIYPSDFLRPGESPRCHPVELKLMTDENGLVTLDKTAPKEMMWGRYWYRSGINQTMKNELKNVVDSILPLMKFDENSIWLDIACNDGSLLSFVPEKFIKIGIDPAEDSFKQEAEKHADEIVQDYFSAAAYKKSRFGNQKAKVITCIAMFYDLEEPDRFLQDIKIVIEDDGLLVMQLSYTGLMLHQTAFDNICHEHYAYYTVNTLANVFHRNGFKIMDVQLNDINGGSMRVYAMNHGADLNKFATQPYRDVCWIRQLSLLSYESLNEINDGKQWKFFFEELQGLKKSVVGFIKAEKENGKTIWAYGASTKGNTLLQYFGLDHKLIDGIADRNIDKWGLRTVGTNIPIYSESDMRKAKPDFLLILPWHFINEFKEREKEYLENGGHFIVPCPQFMVI